jgi:LuxR family maltose regulon positive regulatory protein
MVTPLPDIRSIAAMKTRVWIQLGRLDEAARWADESGVSVEDELGYRHEFEHITVARLLLAKYQKDGVEELLETATDVLKRLQHAAEEGGRMGSAIEIMILLAIANAAKGDVEAALRPLARALSLAEPEGYIRTFVDEGESMATLLTEAIARGISPGYSEKLLAAFDQG